MPPRFRGCFAIFTSGWPRDFGIEAVSIFGFRKNLIQRFGSDSNLGVFHVENYLHLLTPTLPTLPTLPHAPVEDSLGRLRWSTRWMPRSISESKTPALEHLHLNGSIKRISSSWRWRKMRPFWWNPLKPHRIVMSLWSFCVINAWFGEEEQSMLLNELMIDLFAGHGFIDRLSGVRKFIGSGLWQRREICFQHDTVCSIF